MSIDRETEQLAQFFESRYALVLKVASRYAPRSKLTHDIVQQTFMLFVQGVREKKWNLEQENINALLFGIAKNVAMKIWAKEQKNSPEALKRIGEYLLQNVSDFDPTEWNESTERRLLALKPCMEKLTSQSRSFLDQHYREGTAIEELGKQNNIQPKTLRKMFSRLRAKLRECIEQSLKNQGMYE